MTPQEGSKAESQRAEAEDSSSALTVKQEASSASRSPPPFFFSLANISWVFITYNWMILSTPSLLSLLYRSLGSRDPWVPGIPGWESLTKHQGEHRNVFVVSVDLDLYLIQISISNLLIHVY